MLQQQQPNRDQREHVHHGMNFFTTANYQIKANVRNEAPEYSLGDREGQGDEDYSQKRGQTLFYFAEVDVVDALEHRRSNEHQNRGRSINRYHSRQRRQKEAREEAKRGEN